MSLKTKRLKAITRLINLSLVAKKYGHDLHVEMHAHIECVSVKIWVDGYHADKRSCYDQMFYYDGGVLDNLNHDNVTAYMEKIFKEVIFKDDYTAITKRMLEHEAVKLERAAVQPEKSDFEKKYKIKPSFEELKDICADWPDGREEWVKTPVTVNNDIKPYEAQVMCEFVKEPIIRTHPEEQWKKLKIEPV